jgi:hypothetical protein
VRKHVSQSETYYARADSQSSDPFIAGNVGFPHCPGAGEERESIALQYRPRVPTDTCYPTILYNLDNRLDHTRFRFRERLKIIKHTIKAGAVSDPGVRVDGPVFDQPNDPSKIGW